MTTSCRLAVGPTLRILSLALLLVLVAGLAQASIPPIAASGTEVVSARTFRWMGSDGRMQTVPDLAVSGRLLVQFRLDAGPAAVASTLQRQGGALLNAFRTPGLFLVSLPAGTAVSSAARAWSNDMNVVRAEPDRLVYRQRVPNDPRYTQQYHHQNIASEAAWDLQTGASNVVIAIIDDGVDMTHEDLAGRIWNNADEVPGNGLDDDDNGYVDDTRGWDFTTGDNDPTPGLNFPDNDHGTHVAGCAAATGNNATGVAGPDWACRIMPLRVFDDAGGSSFAWILAAIEYATANGADVINMSLGGGYTESLTPPITAAWQAGISVVCAAGNEYSRITDSEITWRSPLCNDGENFGDNHVLGVGATDDDDVKADFSNYDASSQSFVDVMAPGVQILSTLPFSPTTGYNNTYGLMSGTSMACPVTAGVVGLLHAEYPGYGPDQIMYQLRQGCDNIDAQNPAYVGQMGAGRINAFNALRDMPPGPARSVQAFDTPGVETASVSVVWNASLDDGRGANDVVSYEVMRATAPEGPFDSLTTPPLAKGSKAYEDTTVVEGTDYYYKVVVRDPVNAVESTVAGPAQTRDDVAPPAVTVAANDTQGDQGGSLTLSWGGYAPPADCAGYRIYRAEAVFSAIDADGVDLINSLSNISQKNYQDRGSASFPVVDDTDYWYAVTAVDRSGNELKTVAAAGPVRANPNFTLTYPPGLSLFALGLQPRTTDLGVLFNRTGDSMDFARWNPALNSGRGGYVRYSEEPTNDFLSQQLGRGYWLRTTTPLVANISGARAEGNVEADFVAGWNQLGNPYDQTLAIAPVRVRVNGTLYDLGTSNASGYTADYFWAYDSFAASYRLISATMPFARTDVRKGEGFFFYANRPGQVVMSPPVAAATATGEQGPAPAEVDWSLRLVASAGVTADTDNFLGVSTAAETLNGVSSPPPVAGGVDLYFPAQGGRRATQFVSEAGAGQTWSFRVACPRAGTGVKLSWPDLSALPADCRPVLKDWASGQKTYLRTSTAYSFTLGSGEVERAFTLELGGKAGDLLAIRSLQAQTNGRSVQISYSLSAPAAVSAEILNLAGRVVRVLPTASNGAGLATALWDARGASGVRVPAGAYLVRLTAHTSDGQSVSAVQSLQLR